MKHIITIPNGRRFTAGQLVDAWRTAQTLPPDTTISDWQWFPVTAADVLRDLSGAVHDRINKHLPQHDSKHSPQHRLAKRITRGALSRSCRWCGQQFTPDTIHDQFCGSSCRRSFYF